jgi:hypothetical protein
MGKGQRFEPASSNLCEFRPNPSGPDQKPAQGMFTATELRDWRRRVFTRVAVSSVDDARSHFALASGNCHAHTRTANYTVLGQQLFDMCEKSCELAVFSHGAAKNALCSPRFVYFDVILCAMRTF